jgi:hypothetical protein
VIATPRLVVVAFLVGFMTQLSPGYSQSFQGANPMLTGAGFLSECAVPTTIGDKLECGYYVIGLGDSFGHTHASRWNCLPREVTYLRTYDLLLAFIQTHPNDRSRLTATLFEAAMYEAYPCLH